MSASGLDIATLTAVYKLLGDETRLRVLSLLGAHELAVGEIQKILGTGQSTLSSQLALLKDQELVASRKEGQKVFYRLSSGGGPAGERKREIVRGALEAARAARWQARDARLLTKTLAERAEGSRAFFNTANPEAVQNLTSPGQTWQALAEGMIGLLTGARIVDLGCGNGRLARRLAEAGNAVTGVDASEEQIRLARSGPSDVGAGPQQAAALQDERPASPMFILAPMENTGLPDASFDIAVISQALHHAAEPREAVAEACRLLVPGGRLLILDLLAHEEDWMRTRFGDFWLGFAEDDLRTWVTAAGIRIKKFEITPPSPEYPELEGVLLVGQKS